MLPLRNLEFKKSQVLERPTPFQVAIFYTSAYYSIPHIATARANLCFNMFFGVLECPLGSTVF